MICCGLKKAGNCEKTEKTLQLSPLLTRVASVRMLVLYRTLVPMDNYRGHIIYTPGTGYKYVKSGNPRSQKS